MKPSFSLLLVLFLPGIIFSQLQLNYEWTTQTGGTDGDYVYDMDRDDAGNIYLLLNTYSTDVHIADSAFTGAGNYIVKCNEEGSVIWASYAHCTKYVFGLSLHVMPDGDIYTMGVFMDTAWFGQETLMDTTGYPACYLQKLTNDGEQQWARLSGISTSFTAIDMVMDEDDNMYLTGRNSGNTMVAGDDTLHVVGGVNMPVIKLDSNATVDWALLTSNPYMARATAISRDSDGNIILAGDFVGLYLVYGQDSIVPDLQHNILLSSVNPDGEFNWLNLYGYDGSMIFHDMNVNNAGDIFTTGKFEGKYFFPDTLISIPGFHDQFGLFKFTPDGNYLWHVASEQVDYPFGAGWGHDIEFDEDGNIWIAGRFSFSLDIMDFRITATIPMGYFDNFICMINPAGRVELAMDLYGCTYDDDGGERKILCTPNGLLFSGYFDFEGTFGSQKFNCYGLIDQFLSMLSLQYVGLEGPLHGRNIYVFSSSGKIFIKDLSEESKYRIRVMDPGGRVCYDHSISGKDHFDFSPDLMNGFYLVEVVSSDERKVEKILFLR